MNNLNKIEEIQKILKYEFKNKKNLINSLIHPSVYINKKKINNHLVNEFDRLEFLGDRVLGLVIASLIFEKFSKYNEGSLSKKLSYLVQREFLYKIAQEINLEKFIKFNRKVNKSILADSIESIIGAIYIDGGFNNSYKVIKRIWTPYLDDLDSYEIDPKTKLQEISQKKFKKLPEYKLLNKEGPPHSPKFTISLDALNIDTIKVKGNSIREAEKKAANKILKLINEK